MLVIGEENIYCLSELCDSVCICCSIQSHLTTTLYMHEKHTHARGKCLHTIVTSHVEGDQFLNSQHALGCRDMVARGIIFEIPRLSDKCTLSLTK